jgi:hypothetical protein
MVGWPQHPFEYVFPAGSAGTSTAGCGLLPGDSKLPELLEFVHVVLVLLLGKREKRLTRCGVDPVGVAFNSTEWRLWRKVYQTQKPLPDTTVKVGCA